MFDNVTLSAFLGLEMKVKELTGFRSPRQQKVSELYPPPRLRPWLKRAAAAVRTCGSVRSSDLNMEIKSLEVGEGVFL